MSEWISVDDKLPESPYRKVIVWVKMFYADSYMDISTYRSEEWTILKEDTRLSKVTHWQHLPEPPK